MSNTPHDNVTPDAAAKPMSAAAFTGLGQGQIAYVKPLTTEGGELWAIHAANGEPLAVMESRDMALTVLRQNELEAFGVH